MRSKPPPSPFLFPGRLGDSGTLHGVVLSPQFMVTKDVAAAYVIARKGLGLKERVPKNYMHLLRFLDVEALGELRQYVRNTVRNRYLQQLAIRRIDRVARNPGSLDPVPGASIPFRGAGFPDQMRIASHRCG